MWLSFRILNWQWQWVDGWVFNRLSTAPPRTLAWARAAQRKACARSPVGRPRALRSPCRLALLACLMGVDAIVVKPLQAVCDCLHLSIISDHAAWLVGSGFPTRGWTQALGRERWIQTTGPSGKSCSFVLWNKPPFPTPTRSVSTSLSCGRPLRFSFLS